MEFLEYLKQRETDYITAMGEQPWLENKRYPIDEIVALVEGWQASKKFEIQPADIHLFMGGFECKKITNLSDGQLVQIRRKLHDSIASVHAVNIYKYKYLAVWWRHKEKTSTEETNTICDILNSII